MRLNQIVAGGQPRDYVRAVIVRRRGFYNAPGRGHGDFRLRNDAPALIRDLAAERDDLRRKRRCREENKYGEQQKRTEPAHQSSVRNNPEDYLKKLIVGQDGIRMASCAAVANSLPTAAVRGAALQPRPIDNLIDNRPQLDKPPTKQHSRNQTEEA